MQDTDPNGNVHQYSYDVLGRLTSDAVTTLGAGVDGSVRRITYGYDSQGNLSLITSYDAASGGNIVNQVQRVYNGLGQLSGEYQSHSGAVVQGSTPEVQYAYTEMSGGQNNSRLTSMTYPSGYALNYNYNTGLDSDISQLSSISDSGGTLENYKYLGLNTVVETDHPQTNVNLTYIHQTNDTQANSDGGDQYTGLDRFGRVIDQFWIDASNGTTVDRYQYGYNGDGDVLYRANLVDPSMSELYTYDNLNQLTSFQRGTLNATRDGISGTPSASQSWTPDALGNFTGVTTDGTTQTRTANQQNEYTSISGSGTITYDANGNTTADGTGNTYIYDAWNRVVSVQNNGSTIATYRYDGLGRLIQVTEAGTTTDLYVSSADQVLQEYQGSVMTAYNVWSPVYVNALVFREPGNGHMYQRIYVLQDANWNVTALLNLNLGGQVVERYAYDPFGALTVMSSSWVVQSSSSYDVPTMWQGMRYDWTTTLYITSVSGRVYDPVLMRWLQIDPLGQVTGPNGYETEGNGPTDGLDPSGLAPLNDREREQMVKRKNIIAQRLAFLERDAARFVKDIESKGKNASEADKKLAAEYKAELAALKAEYDALSKELGSDAREQQEAIERLRRRAQADWDITSTYAEQNIARIKRERQGWREFVVYQAINILTAGASEGIGALSAGRAAALAKTPCPLAGENGANAAQYQTYKDVLRGQEVLDEALTPGKGTSMAGAGSTKVLRDSPRLAAEYGGNPSDWAKMGTSSRTLSDGRKIEIHWYENVKTGQKVEFKTKIQ